MPMADTPSSSHIKQVPLISIYLAILISVLSARSFVSADGRRYEWRRCANVSSAYDLYALNPLNVRIAAFRRCSEETPVGRSPGRLQYTSTRDGLLLYSLLTLSLNRWVDIYAV
ncbi:hypothetical protein B0H10DRAFT_1982156 [Mycena sp. CBHHK59/15]|nr:hypothetical protein B0H10DRAFT_1982156 [Mycena sp. CBHHK59/15]